MIYPPDALILAPLSGFTDLPYRRAAREGGCRFAFTEMVDAASLTYARARGEKLLLRGPEEEFLGVQLVGRNPEFLKCAADVLNEHDFSLLDFNLGCPVPKVAKKGAGAELGRQVDRALECFALLKERTRFPLTAKIRILSETDPEPTLKLTRGLAAIGAPAITIHGRIKEAFYSGPVHYAVIRAVREALPNTEIIANGGVANRAKYDEIRRETGCTRIMLARGAMGNPWLFTFLTDPDALPPSVDEWKALILRHIDGMIELYGEESAMCAARKILHDYFKGHGIPGELRAQISHLTTRSALLRLLSLQHKLIWDLGEGRPNVGLGVRRC